MAGRRFGSTAVSSTAPATPGLSDEALIADILSGGGGEFESLVRSHQSGVYAFLLRMVRNPEEAADLTQEVFVKVFSNLEQFNPQYRFKTWLYRIAANAAVDRRRRARKDRGLTHVDSADESGPSQLRSSRPGPHEFFSALETRDRLQGALSEMPPAYRQVILLRYQNEMRYDEIARVTRLPIGTVKNRIFRAREMLKRALA